MGSWVGRETAPQEVPVTTAQLYQLYVRAYRDAPRLLGSGVDLREVQLLEPSPPVARVVALLALDDATNGRPMRTRSLFERAVAQGARALLLVQCREQIHHTDVYGQPLAPAHAAVAGAQDQAAAERFQPGRLGVEQSEHGLADDH